MRRLTDSGIKFPELTLLLSVPEPKDRRVQKKLTAGQTHD